MTDVERARYELFRNYHGKDIRSCQVKDADGEDVTPSVEIWQTGCGIGTRTIAVCSACHSSLDITEYEAW